MARRDPAVANDSGRARLELEFEQPYLLGPLFGDYDRHLITIEQRLGVHISARGNRVQIEGDADSAARAREVLVGLYNRLDQGHDVDSEAVEAVLGMAVQPNLDGIINEEVASPPRVMIRTRKKTIVPRSTTQTAYMEALSREDMIFALGPAGTGKTYVAVAQAVSQLIAGTVDRLILSRPAVEAGDVCVTRGEMICVPSTIPFDDLVRAFAEAEHSRLPVYGESLDEIVGMIHIKDVFKTSVETTQERSVLELLREPLFIPESMGVLDLLARMRSQRIHLAIVVDEFGGTEGLVTIEDVVEEIVGEIEDEHDIEEAGMLTLLEDGVWEADARIELEELAKAVDARLVWEEDEVDTLGGLVFLLAGHIPAKGECVEHPSGWKLEAVDSDPRKILRVRLHAPDVHAQGG